MGVHVTFGSTRLRVLQDVLREALDIKNGPVTFGSTRLRVLQAKCHAVAILLNVRSYIWFDPSEGTASFAFWSQVPVPIEETT